MNCIIIDDDKILRRITEEFINKTEFLHLSGAFDSAVEALAILNKEDEKIHLIFLDIEMPEMTGIEFLNHLRNLPQIIIISSKDKYAITAFEYDVTDYLLKPFPYARFYKAAYKAYEKFAKIESENGFFIKSNTNSLVRVSYEDILWVEALENYVVVNCFDYKYTIHFTMKAMVEKLPADRFARVHRSFIVNTRKINEIEESNLIIKTKNASKIIPIAKSYKDKLMSYINLVAK